MALTEKQKRFVQEYLVDLNATQAAIRAEYSERTAYSQGQRLLKKVEIQNEIQKAQEKRSERTEITQDDVVKELAKIAFADGSDFAQIRTVKSTDRKTGKEENIQIVDFKDTEKLDKNTKSAISQIKMGKFGPEVVPCDKLRALELLGKHLGMFEKHEPAAEQQEMTEDPLSRALREEAEAMDRDNAGSDQTEKDDEVR